MTRGKPVLAALLAIMLLSCGGKALPPVGRGLRAPPPSFPTTNNEQATTEVAGVSPAISLDEALGELDALPVPEGVDESLFSDLKSALRQALLDTVGASRLGVTVPLREKEALATTWIADVSSATTGGTPVIQGEGEKLVSSPPTGASNRVNNLIIRRDGEDYLLQWRYRNVGDYNQDGIVNIMDITPLAVHFNEEAKDSNEVIDGNEDTVINILDITPLAAHFFCDLARYSIQTSPSQTGTFTEIDSAPFSVAVAGGSTRLRFSVPLPEGASGFIRVVPMDSSDNPGIPSNIVPVPALTPPQPPASVQATDGYYADKVEITWDAPASGPTPEGYHVYRADSEEGTYSPIGESATSPYDDESIPLGDYSHYWYKVGAYNASGESELAGPDAGWKAPPPNAPGNVEASDGTYAGKIQVSWDAPAEGPSPDGYRIYRADSEDGTYTEIDTSPASPFDDTTVPDFAAYWFKVSAFHISGESEFSAADSGFRASGPQPPDPPINLDATDGVFPDKVQVSWDAPASGPTPDGYSIYRSDSEGGTYALIGDSPASPFDDTTVPDFATYWYKISAYNADGESALAGPESGYRDSGPQPPNPPEDARASKGTSNSFVRIWWTPATGGSAATGFRVYRSLTEDEGYTQVADVPAGETQYDDYAPDLNLYWYQVTAYNADGESDPGGPDFGYRASPEQPPPSPVPPDPPGNVEASDGTYTDRIEITWTAPGGPFGPHKYLIWRSTVEDGTYSYIGYTNHPGIGYDDYPDDYQTYWYKVSACNDSGESSKAGPDSGFRGS